MKEPTMTASKTLHATSIFFVSTLLIISTVFDASAQQVFFTTGIKIGEVTDSSAMIWTRLCSQKKPNKIRHERKETVFRHPLNFDENMPVAQMDGGVQGTPGLVRATLTAGRHTVTSTWQSAVAEHDFTVKIPFSQLQPDTAYEILLEAKASPDSKKVSTTKGSFRTAPRKDAVVAVQLTTSTCQYFWSYDDKKRGFSTYDQMNELQPDFFIHTGDYIYYDKPGPEANTIPKARHKWHAMDAWPSLVDFHQHTPIYMLKDDHDLLSDDAHPQTKPYGELTFEDGLKLWHENTPLEGKPYRSIRWGKDLQIWMVEGREYRSSNNMEDGSEKSIWGNEQKEWFKATVQSSDATFKILFTATPVVGPDRENKADNHANEAFEQEGSWLRTFLASQKNMYVVNGDRHWQYVSQDDKTGLMEFGSGPVSDYHAQGWDPNDKRPEHRYLNLIGGFLGIRVFREEDKACITFTHYDVHGEETHEEKFNTSVRPE